MATTLLPKDLIRAVEATLQRANLDGMRVHTAAGRAETGSARFANESILRYCDIAAVHVASLVRAESVRPLFEDRTPSGGSFDLTGILRLRGVTPNVNGTPAYRRTSGSNDYYTDRGAPPTANQPAWQFEGGEFFITDGSKNPSGSQANFVTCPLTGEQTVSGDTLTGSTLSTDALKEKHEETIAYLVDSSGGATDGDEYSARILDASVSGTDVDTQAPDSTYDVHYFDHACTELGVRHETAVVEFASALCFASIGRSDPLETSLANFDDEVQSDLLPAFDLREIDQ